MSAVEKLLIDKGITYKNSGKDFVISCLNPEHEDNNPSCRVDKVSGVTHCFACGWKVNIFKHFGIFTSNSNVKIVALKEKLLALLESSMDLELPPQSSPFNEPFRGISAKTFKKFGAFHTEGIEKLKDRIVFPIKDITDKNIAFIGRFVLSNANPRYVVHPSGKALPLYPLKMPDKVSSCILVEGIFDMLKMHDVGITNTVCCFGTSTISEDNVIQKTLALKVQGISKVYIMFDGDDPGKQAAKKLKPLLEAEGFEVEIIDLPEDCDPCDLDDEQIESIKRYVNAI